MRSALPLLVAAAFACACGARSPSPPQADDLETDRKADALARVGERVITEAEFRARLAAAPPGGDARDTWNALFLEALVDEAVARHHPGLADLRKELLVERFIKEEIEPRLAKDKIPNETLRGLYERAKHVFVHGRLVTADVLCLYTGPTMRSEAKAARKAAADALAQELAKVPAPTGDDFARLADDPRWIPVKLQRQQLVLGAEPFFSPAMNKRFVDALRRPGDYTGLIADDNVGFFFARYVSEQPPKNESFEAAKARLADGLWERWRNEEFLNITNGLVRKHKVELYPDVLLHQATPPRPGSR